MPRISRKKIETLLTARSDGDDLDIFAIERLAVAFGYREDFLEQLPDIGNATNPQSGSNPGRDKAEQILKYCSDNIGTGAEQTISLETQLEEWFGSLETEEQQLFCDLALEAVHSKRLAFPIHILDLRKEHPQVDVDSLLISMEQRGIVWRNPENDQWETKVLVHLFAAEHWLKEEMK